jgi:hypothetical protein
LTDPYGRILAFSDYFSENLAAPGIEPVPLDHYTTEAFPVRDTLTFPLSIFLAASAHPEDPA